MDGEAGRIGPTNPGNHRALGIHQQQVADPDVSEVDTERVDPEALGMLGVAGGDVPAGTVVEAEPGEQPQGRGELLQPVPALLLSRPLWTLSGHPQPPAVS